ncbi:MAG: class I SAM-dependent methyltransferase [Bacteroidales bacterium]|nr:class I SAM-dependent methyltransferase [Bacteroidales bacterium]
MKEEGFDKNYAKAHNRRFLKTYGFIEDVVEKDDMILDLGPVNPFSQFLVKKGFRVENTPLQMDLDLDYDIVKKNKYDVVTAFEIFEHLVSPFPLLHSISAKKLVASVPLRLWFAPAYWSDRDPHDRHYHEFEPRQFDMLLDKAGWKIIKSEKWKTPTKPIGIRPILRNFTPRHYIVYCERK